MLISYVTENNPKVCPLKCNKSSFSLFYKFGILQEILVNSLFLGKFLITSFLIY